MGELEDLEKERADQADRAESSTTSWQSLHMSVAEKRALARIILSSKWQMIMRNKLVISSKKS